MKKRVLTTLLLLQGLNVFTQNRLIGIWKFKEDKYKGYKIYVDDKNYFICKTIGEIYLSKSKYGFSNKSYDSYHYEETLSVDSLTISEKDYFYVYDPKDVSIKLNQNGGNTIDTIEYINGDTIMTTIYYGMREGYTEYKKVNIISKIIEDYLKDKEPAIYADYLKVAWNRGEIKVKKSIIHTDKKVATKAYLVKDDVIEILERQAKWLRIRYTSNKNKITTGWIKKSDVK